MKSFLEYMNLQEQLANGIAVEQDQSYAPGCYIVCKVVNGDWNERGPDTVLIQTDHDFPGLAYAFGMEHNEDNDESQEITAAIEFLDNVEGKVIEDPGYFA